MVALGGTRRRITRAVSLAPWLIAWTVLVAQAPPAIQYLYDENGRLAAVIDPSAAQPNAAVYHYDEVGNITSIERRSSATVSIIGFSPPCAAANATVTIYGIGFSSTPSQNTVTFTGASGVTAITASSTQLTAVIPAGATSGSITVTAPNGTANSAASLEVGACGAPTLTSVSPSLGDPGTSATFTGTSFGATSAENRLAFHLKLGRVDTVASSTQLTATVAAATSGRTSLSTAFGTAVGPDFFIPPPPFTASSVQFTSRVAIGESKVVPITTAGKIGLLIFDGTQGQRISVNLTSNMLAPSVTLYAPDGTVVASLTTVQTFLDVLSLPVTGTYTILVNSGAHTGSITVTVYQVTDIVGTIMPGGAAVPVTITTPGQNALYSFAGTAGQSVSLLKTSDALSETTSILKPDGSTLASTSGNFIDVQTLPVTGMYTVFVDPQLASTGSVTLNLYLVPTCTGSITPGGAGVTATVSTPGQDCRFTFTGTAGQRVSLNKTSDTLGETTSILDPAGATVGGTTGTFLEPQLLPTNGTYTVLVDATGANTGAVTVTLYDVPPDCSGTITIGGSGVTATITAAGQNCVFNFAGTSGQRMSLAKTSDTLNEVTYVLKPDGSTLASTGASFIEPQTLPTSGTYSVLVDGSTTATGSVTITLYDVPADGTGSVTINGSGATFTISAPGQNWRLTFAGNSGQQVTVHATANSIPGTINVSILNPNGSVLTFQSWSGTGFNLNPKTLTATGTHTIVVDPTNANTGTITISVTNP
jgi:uncharacterized protein YhfF